MTLRSGEEGLIVFIRLQKDVRKKVLDFLRPLTQFLLIIYSILNDHTVFITVLNLPLGFSLGGVDE